MPAEAFEVLVIDNGSIDDTAEVVRRHSALLQLRYIEAPEPGLHVGRHEGMRQAQSDVLMFADDDIEAGPRWVEAVVRSFANANVALVGGNNHPLFEATPPAWLMQWWEKPVHKGRALPYLSILDFGEGVFAVDPSYVWGCNFSIRRDVLLQAGGFHPDAVPRERLRYRGDGETHISDVVRTSGLTTLFDSAASVHHWVSVPRMRPGYFEQRAYAQGISDSYTAVRRLGGLATWPCAWLRHQLGRSRFAISKGLEMTNRNTGLAAGELRSIQTSVALAYHKGYSFHQQEVRSDPALLAWVLRGNYF